MSIRASPVGTLKLREVWLIVEFKSTDRRFCDALHWGENPSYDLHRR